MTVIGREQEYKLIRLKIEKFVIDEVSSTIYISGVPGSGKTHTLNQVLRNTNLEYLYVNAGQLKYKSSIYKEIYEKISCNKTKNKDFLTSLRNHLVECETPHILVIDEVDLLVNRQQNFLYNIFDFAYLENSKLLLILVSNTMNLPEKTFESKICSRIGKNRIDFKPYTHAKLKKIISNKFKGKDILDIELITRRVASVFGDIRKAFNLIEKSENSKEINTIITDTLSPLEFKILPNLSKYQKYILYVICNTKEISVANTIYKNFEVFCKSYGIRSIDFYDFLDSLEILKLFGIIKYRTYTDKVVLLIEVTDVEATLKSDEDFNIATKNHKK